VVKELILNIQTDTHVRFYIQGDSRSFTLTYGAYSWGNLVQNLLINLVSVLNSYGVIVDFLNASV
jgi:hypothetical protein